MNDTLFTTNFWHDTLERAASTAAQFVIVLAGADGTGLLHANLWVVLAGAASGAVLAILKAIVAAQSAGKDTASLVGTKIQ